MKLSASLICADQGKLVRDVKILNKNKINFLHIDVMDGIFVPRLGMYPEQVKSIRKHFSGKINTHLMISSPENYIDSFINNGSDIITIHYESTKNITKTLEAIKNKKAKAGICLKIETPVEKILDFSKKIDYIMLMSIRPGVLGQQAWEGIYNKILTVKTFFKNVEVEIDGGVTYETAKQMKKAGATVLTCGTGVFFNKKLGSLDTAIKKFKAFIR